MRRIRRYGAVVAAAAASVAVTASGCGAASTLDPVAKAAFGLDDDPRFSDAL
jgi:hypothetical protein